MLKKIRVISDLHLEFYKVPNIVSMFKRFTPADYLILAGDVSNYDTLPKFKELLDATKDDYKKIFYVLGNHEYYNAMSEKKKDVVEVFRKFSSDNGLIFLHNQEHEDDNFIIRGTPLWSNVSKDVYDSVNDINYITYEDYINNHLESEKFLNDTKPSTESNKPLIIVTHHMPSYSLIDKKYASYSRYSSFFATDLDSLIYKIQPAYWIYGHTHTRKFLKTHNTTFICNPLGYPGENKMFDDTVFEL